MVLGKEDPAWWCSGHEPPLWLLMSCIWEPVPALAALFSILGWDLDGPRGSWLWWQFEEWTTGWRLFPLSPLLCHSACLKIKFFGKGHRLKVWHDPRDTRYFEYWYMTVLEHFREFMGNDIESKVWFSAKIFKSVYSCFFRQFTKMCLMKQLCKDIKIIFSTKIYLFFLNF